MNERIEQEVALLRARYPGLQVSLPWIRIPGHRLCSGWNHEETDIAFRFPEQYPQNPFYGFHTKTPMRFNGHKPGNYEDAAAAPPPFTDQAWSIFSGNPEGWSPKADVRAESNVLSWVSSILGRLREGQ